MTTTEQRLADALRAILPFAERDVGELAYLACDDDSEDEAMDANADVERAREALAAYDAQASRLATRQHFHDIDMACIAEAESGAVYVNDLDEYRAWCLQRAADALAGKIDHTFTFQQRAYWIETGECVALLP